MLTSLWQRGKCVLSLSAIVFFIFGVGNTVFAQSNAVVAVPNSPDAYVLAQVISVTDEHREGSEAVQELQHVQLRIIRGEEEGKEIAIDHGADYTLQQHQRVSVGEKVVLMRSEVYDGTRMATVFYILEPYRIPALGWIALLFVALAVIFGKRKGLLSLVGLVFTIWVLLQFVVPAIVHGRDPLLSSLVGAVVIACVSLFVAHGFHARTGLAVVSTLVTLGASAVLAYGFVHLAQLFGYGSEEAFFLQTGGLTDLNLRGLLLGGIIIGALGVLDDITTAQTAAIEEIHKANHALGFRELYQRGFSVGGEHIASLVNTLALAYVGASFPVLLLFAVNTFQPLWVTLNSENIAEEVVRTLVGSSALVLAVPLSTVLAAWYFSRKKNHT